MPPKQKQKLAFKKRRSFSIRRALAMLIMGIVLAGASYLTLCCFGLLALRYIDPWFTTVQAQRRIESWFQSSKKGAPAYQKRHTQVPLGRISVHLQHAVIASEDGRFYTHHGIDWQTIEKLAEEDFETGKITRGGSTITQQLVKNLFATTHRNVIRKGIEFILAPVAESVLSKERILELYLNNIEWGVGVFGAEAASQYHYRTSAATLTRDQATRLAVCVPGPRKRRPQQMGGLAAIIDARMHLMGW